MHKFTNKSRYCVIGYGSWGTAIAKILLTTGEEIGWFVSSDDVRNHIESEHKNLRYLTNVEFPRDKKIHLYSNINEAVRESDILIFATPSMFLCNTLSQLTESLDGKMVISAIKGILTNNDGEYVTITEYFNQVYGVKYDLLGVLTGPCHAEEVALERFTYINIVCKDLDMAKSIAERFDCEYMCPNALTDIYGAEYSAVMKNIYAIAVGICSELGYGDNFISVLISNGFREITHYLDNSYTFERDSTRSAYMGDLLVTCYSLFSRNRTFGAMIGRGYTVARAKSNLNDMVAEGYLSTECIYNILKSRNIKLPIVEAIYDILYNGNLPATVIASLSRKLT